MFLTPTHKPIDMDALTRAALDRNAATAYALDIETGEVEFHSDFIDTPQEQTAASGRWDAHPERYFAPPRIPGYEQYRWREDFIRGIVATEDMRLAGALRRSIAGKDAFRRFTRILKDAGDGWTAGWRQWEADAAFEEIQLWLAALPVAIHEELDLDGSCDSCKDFAHGESFFVQQQRLERKAHE